MYLFIAQYSPGNKGVEDRLGEVTAELQKLNQLHWTVIPTFWIVIFTAIISLVGLYLVWKAERRASHSVQSDDLLHEPPVLIPPQPQEPQPQEPPSNPQS